MMDEKEVRLKLIELAVMAQSDKKPDNVVATAKIFGDFVSGKSQDKKFSIGTSRKKK